MAPNVSTERLGRLHVGGRLLGEPLYMGEGAGKKKVYETRMKLVIID